MFFLPQRIDLLIGAILFYELLFLGKIKLSAGLPLLQKPELDVKHPSQLDERLEWLIRKFYEIEDSSEPL